MGEVTREYLIPDGACLADITERIRARVRFTEDPSYSVTRRFFDSFDWRLYLAGTSLEERVEPHGRRLLWRDLRGDGPPCGQTIDKDPGFARDLPEGPVRSHLEPLLGVRRLLPLLEVRGQVQTLRLLNEDDKTVALLLLEENRRRDQSRDREGPLAARLELVPVRGYEADFQKTDRMLVEDLGLEPARTRVLHEALAAVDRRPGDYSSKLDYHLNPDKRADATAKEVLLGLLDTLEANVEGAKENLDPEFLHDLRVATRRTRSGLTQIKGVFAPELVKDYASRFAWVQQITGPMRDLDVYLLDFDSYQASLPVSLRPHLEPVREFLEGQYDTTHKVLAHLLVSRRFRGLLRSWRAFLEASVPERSGLPNAKRSAKEVADERIWRMYRRVRKEGRAIKPDSPPEDLHELRKSCKKLRYLLEFFSSLYAKKQVGALVKTLKVLLDNLGRFQDLAVQAGHLREMAQKMRDEAQAETDTLLAMGSLVGDLLDEQQQARIELARIFADFDKPENRSTFCDLFAPAKRQGRGS
jgi:CHAD domain-containing protein